MYSKSCLLIIVIVLTIACSCTNSGSGKGESSEEQIIKKEYPSPRGDSAFFSMFNLDFPGMDAVKASVEKKDYTSAKAEYLNFRREKSKVKWSVDPAKKPDKAEMKDYPAAEKTMKHLIGPSMGAPEAFLGDDIDWQYNPVDPAEPHFSKEWTWCNVNRMPFWNTLSRAYWSTLDEKFAKEWVSQVIDWVEDNPVPLEEGPGGTLTWRTIESGIRMAGSWMDSYFTFLNSPSFTPEAHALFVTGVIEHGQRLEKITLELPKRSGNWVTMECNGMGTIGILFPELKNSGDLVNEAFARLNKELDLQVYPDGAEVELTPGYHQVSRSNFMELAQTALANGIQLPAGYLDKMKKQYQFNLYLMDPMGVLPPFNDAHPTNVTRSLSEAYEIWKDPEFLFGATLGKKGTKPGFDSYFFNWAGYYIMRSGWNAGSNILWFDAGPVGYGHEHEDKLNLYLYSNGRILLTEPGTYSYDLSEWRRYALSTPGHNTIIVDGKDQHRGDIKQERLINEPLKNPWITSDIFDYGSGVYSSGYQVNKYKKVQYMPKEYIGPKDSTVVHTRHVIFLKPYYFLVTDILTGTGSHRYDAHFHLDAPDALINEKDMSVTTLRNDSVQLSLFPFDTAGLKVKKIIGQMVPILGWLPDEQRKIPTIVYTKSGEPVISFSTMLAPFSVKPMAISSEIIEGNSNQFWSRMIRTPFETSEIYISEVADPGKYSVKSSLLGEISFSSDILLLRELKGKKIIYAGFSGLKEIKTASLDATAEKIAVIFGFSEGKLFLNNPGDSTVEISFKIPVRKKLTIEAKEWYEISGGGLIKTTEANIK